MSEVDQVFEKLKARFKGKGGRPGGLSPGGAGILAFALALLWVFSGTYTVDAQERAVVLRLGAYVTETGPGIQWYLPWPIGSVEKVNVTQVRQVPERSDMLTQDENIIDVDLKVQYVVKSALQYLTSTADPNATLRQVTKSAVREVVGRNKMDYLLSSEGRQDVSAQTQQILQERLDAYGSGLQVSEVNLQNAQAPDAVQDAFLDALKAREDQVRLTNEAEAYANDRLPKAGGAAARERAEATAYRDRLIAQATGEAERFRKVLMEYRKAPRVTRDRLYLEAMTEVFGNTTKIVVDANKGQGPVIYLPLDQMNRATRAGEPGDATGEGVPPRPGSSSESRPRDRGGR